MNISDKDKKMLVFFGLFLAAVLYYSLFLKDYMIRISDLKQKNIELKQKQESLEKSVKQFNADSEKMEEIQSDYIHISDKLPVNQDEKFSIMDAYKISNMLDVNLGDFVISKKEAGAFERDGKKVEKAFLYTLKLNWPLTYENLKKLLDMPKDYDVVYSIDNIMAAPDMEGNINSSFEMKFYGFEDSNAPVRVWNNIPIDIGKSNIFKSSGQSIPPAGDSRDSMEYIEKNKDFNVLISTVESPTSVVTLEKSNGGTSIFGANKSIEDVNIILSGENGSYSYSMDTDGGSYPKNGGSESFKPNSNSIIILIYSEPRKYADDKNRAVINIHNKTDMKVYAYITNDDKKLPRAAIVKDGPNVYVYNK